MLNSNDDSRVRRLIQLAVPVESSLKLDRAPQGWVRFAERNPGDPGFLSRGVLVNLTAVPRAIVVFP